MEGYEEIKEGEVTKEQFEEITKQRPSNQAEKKTQWPSESDEFNQGYAAGKIDGYIEGLNQAIRNLVTAIKEEKK